MRVTSKATRLWRAGVKGAKREWRLFLSVPVIGRARRRVKRVAKRIVKVLRHIVHVVGLWLRRAGYKLDRAARKVVLWPWARLWKIKRLRPYIKPLAKFSHEHHRIVAGSLAGLFILGMIAPIWQAYWEAQRYKISAAAQTILEQPNPNVTKKLQYDPRNDIFAFNAGAKKSVAPGENPVKQLKQQVGGGGADDEQLYSADISRNLRKGVTYYENQMGLSFTLKPQFSALFGKGVDGRLVYPLNGVNGQLIYTVQPGGLKEDIVLYEHPGADEMTAQYKLDLPKSLEAKLLDTGEIGLYSADPTLFGNISYGSSDDAAKVEKVRDESPKTHLAMKIPAPVVFGTDGERLSGVQSSFSLSGDTLTVTTSGLDGADYPLSIDPSIIVDSASEFGSGNLESNVDINGDSMHRGGLTGGGIANQSNTTALSTGVYNQATVAHNGYVYAIGGINSSDTVVTTVQYAAVNSSGTLGSWSTLSGTPLPAARTGHTAVVYNERLYVIGGSANGTTPVSTVYSAAINSDGTLGSWTTLTGSPLSSAVMEHGSVAYNGYVYKIGGTNSSGTSAVSTIFRAAINADGTLDSWTLDTSLPSALKEFSVAAYDSRIYVSGGRSSAGSEQSAVRYVKISDDGTLGSWQTGTALGTARAGHGMTAASGYLYVHGGDDGSAALDDLQFAPIYASGELGEWSETDTQEAAYRHSLVHSAGHLYIVGGRMSTAAAVEATGGDSVYSQGGYQYHEFTSSGTLTVTTGGDVDYLIVAGGGGGGAGNASSGAGGGGGGGDVVTGSTTLSATSHSITVGGGGAGGTSGGAGSDGSDSSAFSLTAVGGGGGGHGNTGDGSDGGSGGGGGGGGFSSGGSSIANGWGNSGGSVQDSTDSGGGGGAETEGTRVTSFGGAGDGGNGASIWGGVYEVGGGGGGSISGSGPSQSGNGGTGGGGAGANVTATQSAAVSGTANTGGGGGGGAADSGVEDGADGGSGVVVARYLVGLLRSTVVTTEIAPAGHLSAGGGAVLPISKVGDRGSTRNTNSETSTSVTMTAGGSISTGNYLVARLVMEANPSTFSVTDPRSNTWTANITANNGGTTVTRIAYARVDTAYQNNDSITFDYGTTSVGIKAIVIEEWQNIHSTNPVDSQTIATGNSTGPSGSALSQTPTSKGQLVYGAFGHEGKACTYTEDSDTTDGTWTTLTGLATTAGGPSCGGSNNRTIDGAYKIVTGTSSQSWNPQVDSAVEWSGTLAIFNPATGDGFYAGGSTSLSRGRAATVMNNGQVFVIGGNDGSSVTGNVQRTTINNTTGSLSVWADTSQSLGTARENHAAALYNGHIYVAGGNDGSGQLTSVEYTTVDTVSGTLGGWSTSGMEALSSAREGLQMQAYNGYLYVFGGFDGTDELDTVERIAINSDGTLDTTTGWEDAADGITQLPEAMTDATVLMHDGYAYLIGGFRYDDRTLATSYYATINGDGTLGSWTQDTTSSLNTKRFEHKALVYNGSIYVSGGSENTSTLASIEFATINADGSLGEWVNAPALATERKLHSMFAYNGQMYMYGGEDGLGTILDTVEYAPVNNGGSGTVEGYGSGASLIDGGVRSEHATVAYNGYLYVLGGSSTPGSASFTSVYKSQISGDDGDLSSWTTDAGWDLPDERRQFSAVAYDGYMYIMGGFDSADTAFDDVYYAAIDENDGSLGAWTEDTDSSLPALRASYGAAVYDGRVYVAGGTNGTSDSAAIYFASFNENGGLGAWDDGTSSTNFTTARTELQFVINNGYAYVIGGYDGTNSLNDVQYGPIETDGSIDSWTQGTYLPEVTRGHAAAVANGYLYVTGGQRGASDTRRTYTTFAALNVNGALGVWQDTDAFNTARDLHGTAISNGHIYVTGGATSSSTSSSSVQISPLNVLGRKSVYSKQFDVNTLARLSNITVSGFRADQTEISVRTAGADNVYGSETSLADMTYDSAPGLCLIADDAVSYVQVTVKFDDATQAAFGDVANLESRLTSVTVEAQPDIAPPDKRLRHGEWFTDSGQNRAFNTCGFAVLGADNTYDNAGYRYHEFTSTGSNTLKVYESGGLSVDYLIVGGGGGGGDSADSGYGGGGGGAGGVVTGSTTVSDGGYSIAVGAGGTGHSLNDSGDSGSNSSAFGVTAEGGGGGGGGSFSENDGKIGGSGGGAGGLSGSATFGGSGSLGEGNDGGDSASGGTGGGGGGGAGAAGGSVGGSSSQGGSGGDGVSVWSGQYTVGGGGGGATGGGDSSIASGGTGGGGNGEDGVSTVSAENGTDGTGGGGGGGGGNGGNGIVVVRYPITDSEPPSGATARYVASNMGLANDDTVTSWSDETTNNHDLTSTSGQEPVYKAFGINGYPAVLFDADSMQTTFGSTLSNPANTVVVVMEWVTTGSNYYVFDGVASGNRNSLLVDPGVSSGKWLLFAGSSTQAANVSPAPSSGTPYLVTSIFDTSSSKIQINETETVSLDPGSDSLTGLTLGNRFSEDYTGNFYISEVMVYDRALDSTELGELGAYVQNKYSINLGY